MHQQRFISTHSLNKNKRSNSNKFLQNFSQNLPLVSNSKKGAKAPFNITH
ncbi:hypothetical protein F542_920 [Bibersteinia trehalosi USDA-ARS-USMARC-188]|uniref:Uncharacterized protein n=2 Tax=Bibersteinia trehalosi TaxID=47735 RepID=A0A4V7I720_BIBTR|nr:hypothetical protein WQG_21680 [Bibersteinia trehalosi USDA-ARS-USMARC-192]AHG80810.1 hypothetical protein F542_920 [Bibersteinia trehalosi USDA-ARS-USMARC-188]AHG82959.1 hypothetical protein F543_950 [Bibersteinia trehalosi USDA-ARS-USMARC-189]